jgi:ring-1,2-phenylacetyl-CoA epoxidase subunit PaaD
MVTEMQTSLPSVAEIWTWLDSVNDPEIPVLSIVDLGIVRQVRWIEGEPETALIAQSLTSSLSNSTLAVTITPTYSGCPATAVIKAEILRELQQHGLSRVRLETQLSPAWTTDWMTERGKKRLLAYGIAPPESQAESIAPLACPRCGSADTRLVSRFGSTPCKAFYTCNSCLEPFDHFKCH